MPTPNAISLHLGLDAVDPVAYGGWAGHLRSCEQDARAMQALADAQGFASRLLLTAEATYPRLIAELTRAAAALACGDSLLVTYAGHGASFQDVRVATDDAGVTSGLGDELDGRDEAWCLFDGFLLDDELHDLLCKLPAGLRVLVVSDSCFSGTVTRGTRTSLDATPPAPAMRDGAPCPTAVRCAPHAIARAVHRAHYQRYAAQKRAAAPSLALEPAAHVILLAACQDGQGAREQPRSGAFTERLLATWDGGRFAGSHRAFCAAIAAGMPPTQQPNLDITGAPDATYVEARPFTPGA